MGAAAARSASQAISDSTSSRWYFLLAGLWFTAYFSLGVVRALRLSHALAWGVPLDKPQATTRRRRSLQRRCPGTHGLRNGRHLAACRERSRRPGRHARDVSPSTEGSRSRSCGCLPHGDAPTRALLPGAILVAIGTQAIHLLVTLYLAPRLGRSSELYGSLGAATVILLWLYFTARLIVASAFLNATAWRRHERRHVAGRLTRGRKPRDSGRRALSCANPLVSRPEPTRAPTWRLIVARILVVLGVLLAVVTIIAGYLRWQAFDNETFRGTATELIANDAVRAEIAATVGRGALHERRRRRGAREPPAARPAAARRPDLGRPPRADRPRREPVARAPARAGALAGVGRPRPPGAGRRPPERDDRRAGAGQGRRSQPAAARPPARRAARVRRQPLRAAPAPDGRDHDHGRRAARHWRRT